MLFKIKKNIFKIIKRLIGLEPIIFCFEGNSCTNSAKDVKF